MDVGVAQEVEQIIDSQLLQSVNYPWARYLRMLDRNQ